MWYSGQISIFHVQLAFSYTLAQVLPRLLSSENVAIKKLVDKKKTKGVPSGEGVVCVGKAAELVVQGHVLSQVQQNLPNHLTLAAESKWTGNKYNRCVVYDRLYLSTAYTRIKSRDSCSVMFIIDSKFDFGKISFFLQIEESEFYSSKTFAVIHPYNLNGSCKSFFSLPDYVLDIGFQRIVPVCGTSISPVVVPVHKLVMKLVHITIDCMECVIIPPNTLSID